MSIVNNLVECAFAGIKFHINSEDKLFTINNAVYNPVGTNNQLIQFNNGVTPLQIPLTIIINENALGIENAYEYATQIERKLKEPNTNILRLGTDTYTVAPAGEISINYNHVRSNEIIIKVTFYERKEETLVSNIFDSVNEYINILNDVVSDVQVTVDLVGDVVRDAKGSFDALLNTFSRINNIFGNEPNLKLTEIKSKLDNITLDKNKSTQAIQTIFIETSTLIKDDIKEEEINSLYQIVNINLYQENNYTSTTDINTTDISRKLQSLSVSFGLYLIILNIMNLDFINREDLDLIMKKFNKKISKKKELINDTVLQGIENAEHILKNREITFNKVIKYNTEEKHTSKSLSLKLYGTVEYAEGLEKINDNKNPHILTGMLNIYA